MEKYPRYFYAISEPNQLFLTIVEYVHDDYSTGSHPGFARIIESVNRRYKPSELYRFNKKYIITDIDENDTMLDMKKRYPEYFI